MQDLKDQLVSANAIVANRDARIETMLKVDEAQRKDLTIALGNRFTFHYPERMDVFGRISDRKEDATTPMSWPQIFTEIGRIMQIKDRADARDFVKGAEKQFGEMLSRLDTAISETEQRNRPRDGRAY